MLTAIAATDTVPALAFRMYLGRDRDCAEHFREPFAQVNRKRKTPLRFVE
jgi:hypothetical protein